MTECECSKKRKHRGENEYRSLINRLSRIEGQVRGIKNMIENDAYCTDVLVQVSAVQAALNAFSKELLSNHIHTCVAENIRKGDDSVIDELVVTLQKLMKRRMKNGKKNKCAGYALRGVCETHYKRA